MDNYDLMLQALRGDTEATRMFCGSYTLVVKNHTDKYYRCKGDVPMGFTKVQHVYDKDGFLLSNFWTLPLLTV